MKLLSVVFTFFLSIQVFNAPGDFQVNGTNLPQRCDNDKKYVLLPGLKGGHTHLATQPSPPKVSAASLTPIYQANAELAEIFILYPYNSERLNLHLFFNKKLVRKLQNGERLAYNLSTEGTLKLTVLTTPGYAEPATLGKNTRSISVRKGKAYYFEINGNGEINYIVNTDKGKEKYNDARNFAGPPAVIAGVLTDSLLNTKN